MAGYTGPYKGAFKEGASGKDCAAVKRCLKRLQHSEHITLTPQFGQVATEALRKFQKARHLTQDGVYGPKTHQKMAPLFQGYEIWLYRRAPVRQSALETWVMMAPGADRAGQQTKAGVKDFVGRVAHQFGHPLIITCGTNHNQYVLGTQRQSDHWTGDAADVGMYGAQLTKLGQSALRAAGMGRLQSLSCRGGVYNVGGWNILFNTKVGGNHYNHLHVGQGH